MILTRSGTHFTILNVGLFLYKNLSNYKNLLNKPNKYNYKFSKTLHTFPKPNQIKNTVLRRKSSITLFNFIYKKLNNIQYSVKFINSIDYRSPEYTLKLKNLFNNMLSTPSNLNNLPSQNKNYKLNNTPHQKEVRLARVKFKPGYQRLWRQARSALKDLIGLNFIYQKQLTKYLVKFYRKTSVSFFAQNELSFDKLIIYSRIAPEYNTFTLFYNSKLFFLNGRTPTSKTILCVLNDFIQLIVSKWYYIFFR